MNKEYKKIKKVLGEFESSLIQYGENKLNKFYNKLKEINDKISDDNPLKKELSNYLSSFDKMKYHFSIVFPDEPEFVLRKDELVSRNNLIKKLNELENKNEK